MDASNHTELIIAGLLLAVISFFLIAEAIRVPYPIFMVIGGLALGLLPGAPKVELAPDLVLLILLPPLLYSAAFFSSLRDLQANLRSIALLSIGLVLATAVVVAVVAHVVMGFAWAPAFVLGAIVAPTDPVAATSIASRLGVPRRVVTIVEGESLINDATALVAYKFAVAAAVTGSFSASHAVLEFFGNAAAGIGIGLAVGYVVAAVRRRLDDAPAEITISLFTPYFAYLPAEALGVSAVLAAVTVGIYLGWRAPQLITPSTRIQAYSVWEILVFLLNTALFILIGLSLPRILDELSARSAGTLIGYGALSGGVVMLVRLAWVFPLTYASRLLGRVFARYAEPPPLHAVSLVGWMGMRGAVSLAAALAIPLTIDVGGAFPDRDLIVFCTFCVILMTLILQGLSLPVLIRKLDIEDDGRDHYEESKARLKAADAALARLDELEGEDWLREDTLDRMRRGLEYRKRRFAARFDGDDDGGYEDRSAAYQRLLREMLEAQRGKIVELRNRGYINDEVMRRVERDLDLEDTRLEI